MPPKCSFNDGFISPRAVNDGSRPSSKMPPRPITGAISPRASGGAVSPRSSPIPPRAAATALAAKAMEFDQKLQQLTELGFDRETARTALRRACGDLEVAASRLLTESETAAAPCAHAGLHCSAPGGAGFGVAAGGGLSPAAPEFGHLLWRQFLVPFQRS